MDAYLETTVHQALVEELAEHPPDALHEGGVKRLVVILKVDPSAYALDGLLPLLGVPVVPCAAHDIRFVTCNSFTTSKRCIIEQRSR